MAMAGLREVLLYAENEGKLVTVTAGATVFSGKVLWVNPLILEQPDTGSVTVIDFDSLQSVSVQNTTGEAVVNACKPQKQTKFLGTRKF